MSLAGVSAPRPSAASRCVRQAGGRRARAAAGAGTGRGAVQLRVRRARAHFRCQFGRTRHPMHPMHPVHPMHPIAIPPPDSVPAKRPYNRPISVYRFPRRARTLCPQLCMGIQPEARFPARSADALPATLYGHFTQAIHRNRPIASLRPRPDNSAPASASAVGGAVARRRPPQHRRRAGGDTKRGVLNGGVLRAEVLVLAAVLTSALR